MLPFLAVSAEAADPPTVVTGGDVSTDGSSGWAVESRNGGTGAFVQGTGTPPLGVGSYYLKSNAIGDKQFLHLTKVDGVPLAGRPITDLQSLSFSSFAANGVYSPYVNIPVHSDQIDANSDGIADGSQNLPAATGNAILVYEPTVAGGAWNVSDTTAPSGLWRLTRPAVTGAGTIPLWTYQSYADWSDDLAGGVINPTFGDIQWIIGDTSSAAWAGKEGWVDDIEVTTTTESATYDLEEGLGSCPVAIDRPAKTFTLTGDCTTNATLTLRDGWTLDGAGHTITAVDPTSGSFTGAVLTNQVVAGGASMYISDVTIHGNLASGCSSSLFGVRFDGARGSFTDSTVSAIRYGAGSGCQSGNSVDITNLGGPTRLPVTVDNVLVTQFQKTGIRANGNVAVRLTDSTVESSDLDLITASNSLQISRGARAYVAGNTIAGNDWDGNDQWSATGVLLYGAEDVTFIRNVVNGDDTDVGFYVSQDSSYQAGTTTLTCNLIERDEAPDSTPSALDLWNTGVVADEDLIARVNATGNTVRGFATDYENVVNEVGGPCASGPVTDLAVDGGDESVTATWTPPSGADYAPVTSYDVTLTPGGQTQTVTDPTATFNGLSAAKEYTVTVVPVNAAGRGAPAAASGTTDGSSTAPGPVTDLTLTGAGTTLTADWSAASGATDYEATLIPGGQVVSGSGTSASFTITPGKEYTVTVVAHNASGWGPGRSASLDTKLPGKPKSLRVVGKPKAAQLTWTAPTVPSPVTDYTITATPTSGPVVTTPVSATGLSFPVTVSGLAKHTGYTFTVTATNAFGTGKAASKTLTGTNVKLRVKPSKVEQGQPATLSGKVTDAVSGQTVSGQSITVFRKVSGGAGFVDRGVKAKTSAKGTFSIHVKSKKSAQYYVVSSGKSTMGAKSQKLKVAVK